MGKPKEVERQSVKIDGKLADHLRDYAKEHGWLFGPFLDKLLRSAMDREGIDQPK